MKRDGCMYMLTNCHTSFEKAVIPLGQNPIFSWYVLATVHHPWIERRITEESHIARFHRELSKVSQLIVLPIGLRDLLSSSVRYEVLHKHVKKSHYL